MELGAEALADALLRLADQDQAAQDLVERLVATPQEFIARFNQVTSSLKRSRRFVRWGESAGFARELSALLQGLESAVSDPRTGAEMVARFYQADKGVLGHCDDSSGHVGDVFRHQAKDLFVGYAARCEDKAWLADLVLKLNRQDDFGVRDALIKCAAEYLPEPVIRTLIKRFEALAGKQGDEFDRRHWYHLVESLARQIKDAPLFERTRLAAWGEPPPTAACIDIAKVYLESGDAPAALAWLEKIPPKETFLATERDHLLLEVHARLGNPRQRTEVAWRIFRGARTARSLNSLLEVIGEERREEVLAGEIVTILAQDTLFLENAAFLVEVGRWQEAEDYLLNRSEQINGDHYGLLLPMAQSLEEQGRVLAATALYRALLDSILRRAQTKTYPHGVRYLKKLERLAPRISDWRTLSPHADYVQNLRQQHGRKSSFWAKYHS
ncbi:DUF6880 family protein [Geoalkalibacter halelectricus]|uniref:DUF6880 family protein n=1 Tax=Geoalkalibacter halelectricus TaxID=2847045 RepID=UPI003D260AB0